MEEDVVGHIDAMTAFKAMTTFLGEYYDRAGNDMETLLADLTLESDGKPLDPAAWDDWIRCVAAVKEAD